MIEILGYAVSIYLLIGLCWSIALHILARYWLDHEKSWSWKDAAFQVGLWPYQIYFLIRT